jgi:hypothetical protein
MERTTISAIRKGYTSQDRLRVYLVEDGDRLLYIGKSVCAITRMESHLGFGEWAHFWGGIFDHALTTEPLSGDYTVLFYSADDCDKAIRQPWDLDYKVTFIEETLIREMAPIFNIAGKCITAENYHSRDE